MADNPTVNGLPVAADEVNGAYHQLVLMEYGPPDGPIRVSTGAPLPVIDAAGNITLASILAKLIVSPATETTLAAVNAALAGTLATRKVPLASATVTQVASNTASVTLQASNGSRRSLIVFNDSTATLYLKYGSAASSSSYTVKMAPGDYWEMPLPVYTGIVTGIWTSANGSALVTEGI
jgi:hypothetical protein